MFTALIQIVIAVSIIFILVYAYLKKDKLASYVAYTILAAIAASMALNGMASVVGEVDFLTFLADFLRFLSGIVVFVELGLIIFLLFFSKFKTKIMPLKVFIIIYVALTLLLELGVL